MVFEIAGGPADPPLVKGVVPKGFVKGGLRNKMLFTLSNLNASKGSYGYFSEARKEI